MCCVLIFGCFRLPQKYSNFKIGLFVGIGLNLFYGDNIFYYNNYYYYVGKVFKRLLDVLFIL